VIASAAVIIAVVMLVGWSQYKPTLNLHVEEQLRGLKQRIEEQERTIESLEKRLAFMETENERMHRNNLRLTGVIGDIGSKQRAVHERMVALARDISQLHGEIADVKKLEWNGRASHSKWAAVSLELEQKNREMMRQIQLLSGALAQTPVPPPIQTEEGEEGKESGGKTALTAMEVPAIELPTP
jgi:chromosome segregation ATPase